MIQLNLDDEEAPVVVVVDPQDVEKIDRIHSSNSAVNSLVSTMQLAVNLCVKKSRQQKLDIPNARMLFAMAGIHVFRSSDTTMPENNKEFVV